MRCFFPLLLVGVLGLLLSSASVDCVIVGFVMTQHVNYGQEIRIVGNTTEFGSWDPSKGLRLTYISNDLWAGSVGNLNPGYGLAYKAVVVDYDTGECYCWMPNPNRKMSIPSDAKSVHFVHVLWDQNTCASSCSNTDACSFSNVGTCSSTSTTREKQMRGSFSIV